MSLPFVKMSGAGNDFVFVEHEMVSRLDDEGLSDLARRLCRRRFSVGADGLVLVESLDADRVRMIYFNSDGSRAGMCGNAARCACRFANWKGWVGERLTLEADDGSHLGYVMKDAVRIGMRDPRVLDDEIELTRERERFRGSLIDTGVPHAVLWVEDVSRIDVFSVGREFRHDVRFRPHGANVNFAEIRGPSHVVLRTYERGVEAETLACGTGAVATAVAAVRSKSARAPLNVEVGGGTLIVGFRQEEDSIVESYLEGNAEIVFQGVIEISPQK